MISSIKQPTKNEIIKALQTTSNPHIEVIEVFDRSSKSDLTKSFDRNISKGPFSIIILRKG